MTNQELEYLIFLARREKIPLSRIDGGGASPGDVPVWDGDEWLPGAGGGSGGEKYLRHDQVDPVTHLLLAHDFGRVPSVQVMDQTARVLYAQVIPSEADVDLTFAINTVFTVILT